MIRRRIRTRSTLNRIHKPQNQGDFSKVVVGDQYVNTIIAQEEAPDEMGGQGMSVQNIVARAQNPMGQGLRLAGQMSTRGGGSMITGSAGSGMSTPYRASAPFIGSGVKLAGGMAPQAGTGVLSSTAGSATQPSEELPGLLLKKKLLRQEKALRRRKMNGSGSGMVTKGANHSASKTLPSTKSYNLSSTPPSGGGIASHAHVVIPPLLKHFGLPYSRKVVTSILKKVDKASGSHGHKLAKRIVPLLYKRHIGAVPHGKILKPVARLLGLKIEKALQASRHQVGSGRGKKKFKIKWPTKLLGDKHDFWRDFGKAFKKTLPIALQAVGGVVSVLGGPVAPVGAAATGLGTVLQKAWK